MTPSKQCKAAGLKSLAELAKISSASSRTLINWHKRKPVLFATILAGAVVIKLGIESNPDALRLYCSKQDIDPINPLNILFSSWVRAKPD